MGPLRVVATMYAFDVGRERGRREETGVLKGHFKERRTYRPPMMAYEATHISDWVRDDLPDLLWPVLLAFRLGDESARLFTTIQQLVIDTLGKERLDESRIEFDGRMTSIERVPAGDRLILNDRLRKSGLLERALTPEDRAIFGMY